MPCDFCKAETDHYHHCIFLKGAWVRSSEKYDPWPLDAELRIRALEKKIEALLSKPTPQEQP